MNWFNKILPPKIKTGSKFGRKGVPEGLWNKCTACQAVLYGVELKNSLQVCTKCSNHMRLAAKDRLSNFLDQGSLTWIGESIKPIDILKFRDQKKYKDRLIDAKKSSGCTEALLAVSGLLKGIPVTTVAFEFNFMGGSMGSVVGERFVIAVNHCLKMKQPLICFSASGGARMQEALFSLMQMAKTSAAISKLRTESIPFLSVLTNPTMGGVAASIAMLGDIIISEPNALIGLAGPRVIKQTVKEILPKGFQRAEFLLAHGSIDMICDRRKMRDNISLLIKKMGFREKTVLETIPKIKL